MTTLARRLSTIKPSASIDISRRAAEMRRAGLDVITLSQGEPDFDTPAHIAHAGKRAIDEGHTRYTDVDGTPELKQAVVAKFERDNGLHYATDQISVGTGGKQVIFNALFALIDPDDEVIIPAPYWVSYPDMVRLAGGMPVCVECDETQDFKLTAEQLEAAITPKTKCLILNSPGNPTGAGYHREELAALGEVLKRHRHVFVISDDIYEYLAYDGWAFTTLAAVVPELFERILTVNGVSKGYAMTGWRIGFATGPRWLLQAMETLQGQQTSGACAVSQQAALAALEGPKDFIHASRAAFQRRRDLMVERLNAIGLECFSPAGAFYAFASCASLIGRTSPAGRVLHTDEDVALALLDEANVAVVQGSAFGLGPYLRIAYALDERSLHKACEAISGFCQAVR